MHNSYSRMLCLYFVCIVHFWLFISLHCIIVDCILWLKCYIMLGIKMHCSLPFCPCTFAWEQEKVPTALVVRPLAHQRTRKNCVLRWSCAGDTSAPRPAHIAVGVWVSVWVTWPEGVASRVLCVAHAKWACTGSALVTPAHHDQRTTFVWPFCQNATLQLNCLYISFFILF